MVIKMRKIGIETTPYISFCNYKEGFKKIKEHGFDCADYQGLINTDNEIYSLRL